MSDFLRRTLLFCLGVSLPIQGIDVLAGGPVSMTPFKLLTALLGIFLAIDFALSGHRFPRDRKVLWLLAFAASLAIAAVQGTVAGAPPGVVMQIIVRYVALVVYYFLVAYGVRSLSDVRLVLYALVLGGVLTVAPTLFGVQVFAARVIAGGGREVGLAGEANQLGQDMVVCLAVSAGLLFTAHSRTRRLLVLGGGAVALVGIALSLSRAAFIAVGGMWALWVYRFRRLDTIKYAIPGVLLAVALAVFAPQSVRDRVDTMVNPHKRSTDGSIQGRLRRANASLHAFASNPLTGIGMANFSLWKLRNNFKGDKVRGSIHNAYLHILVTQGLVGFIPYMMIMLRTWLDYSFARRMAHARRLWRDPTLDELMKLAIFLQIALLATQIQSMSSHLQRSKTMWLLLALSPVLVKLVRDRIAELGAQGGARMAPEADSSARAA